MIITMIKIALRGAAGLLRAAGEDYMLQLV